MFGVTEWTN